MPLFVTGRRYRQDLAEANIARDKAIDERDEARAAAKSAQACAGYASRAVDTVEKELHLKLTQQSRRLDRMVRAYAKLRGSRAA